MADQSKGSQLRIQVNEEYIDGIYQRLTVMQVHLDSDPLAYGPKRLNEKTALVRKHLTSSEQIFTQISGDLAILKRELRKAQALLKITRSDLMANNPHVRAGQTQAIRDATVDVLLKDEIEEATILENSILELEAVLVVVKAKRSDLRDTKAALRDQLKLCQEEIGLGAIWGKKKPPPLEQGAPYDGDLIDDLIQEVDGELHLADKRDGGNGVSASDPYAPTATQDEIEDFLQTEGGANSDPLGSEFDDVFGDKPSSE